MMRHAIQTGSVFLLVLATLAGGRPARGAAGEAADKSRFVVHEWGVLVLNRVNPPPPDAPGVELGPPAALTGQLPPFVVRHAQAYKPRRQDHGWDKPVLYFYGPEGLNVRVTVGTPLGRPVAYWPPPDRFTEKMGKPIVSRAEMMVYTLTEATGMTWEGKLAARPARDPAAAGKDHWWAAARDVPAMYLDTKSASERFVFYEATARQTPAVRAEVSDDALVVRNNGMRDTGPVVVLVNDGKSCRGKTIANVPFGQSARLAKAEVLAEEWPAERVLAACAEQWKAMGMTEEEAAAIVRVWRPDLLETVGVMVIARMPIDLYDKMFPLEVTPRLDELVRVGLVFDALGGQDARAGWLPGLRPTLDAWAKDLAAKDYRERERAAGKFERLGDLARPFLRTLVESPDAEVARAAAVLLKQADGPTTAPADGPPGAVRPPAIERLR